VGERISPPDAHDPLQFGYQRPIPPGN